MGGSLSKYKQRQDNKTGSGNDLQTKAGVNLTRNRQLVFA